MSCASCKSIRDNFFADAPNTKCGHIADCPRCTCARVDRESTPEKFDVGELDSPTKPDPDATPTPRSNPRLNREG